MGTPSLVPAPEQESADLPAGFCVLIVDHRDGSLTLLPRRGLRSSHSFRRPVTVSLGIAPLRKETAGPVTLLHDCDMALYQAKGAGRNRVSIAIAA